MSYASFQTFFNNVSLEHLVKLILMSGTARVQGCAFGETWARYTHVVGVVPPNQVFKAEFSLLQELPKTRRE